MFFHNVYGGLTEDNTISGYDVDGLYINYYSSPMFARNIIRNNWYGVHSNNSSPIFDPTMFWNICYPNAIINNRSYGLVVSGTVPPGAYYSYTQIYDNNGNNTGRELLNNTGQTFNAELIWWGSSSGPSSSEFYPVGSVDYTPWATTPNCSSSTPPLRDKSAEMAQYQKDIENNPDDPASKSKLVWIADYLYENGRGSEVIPYLESLANRHTNKDIGMFASQLAIPYLQREGKKGSALNRSLSIINDSSVDSEIRASVLFNLGYLYRYDLADKDNAIKVFTKFVQEYPSDDLSEIAKMELKELGGEVSIPQATISTNKMDIPEGFSLHQNYPNPFNPETSIGYQIVSNEQISLRIYNINGQLIRTLVNENKEAGSYTVNWNGKDESSVGVPSGIYFYTLQVGGRYKATRKMILMK
jgi:tetratricopeptide (TPR) repeat protein